MPKPGNQTQPRKKAPSGAKQSGPSNALQSYFSNHLKVSKLSFKEQTDRPLATLLTCSVIGIALVLPTLLLILLSNINAANFDWEGSAQITLFLEQNVSTVQAGTLAKQLEQRVDVDKVVLLEKDQALDDFTERFQLDSVIEFLDQNPLPNALLVTPGATLTNIDQIEALMQQLEALEQVESGLLDALWVQRLQSITDFLERVVLLVAIMLALAVLLILGNTIRLAIENRKEEIAVLKLVGGTRPFVCRPFLYMGMLYGLGGSIIAVVMTHIVLAVLYAPIEALASSYQSNFDLKGLGFDSTLLLIVFGTALGWLGAWLAVRRHLDEIEPT